MGLCTELIELTPWLVINSWSWNPIRALPTWMGLCTEKMLVGWLYWTKSQRCSAMVVGFSLCKITILTKNGSFNAVSQNRIDYCDGRKAWLPELPGMFMYKLPGIHNKELFPGCTPDSCVTHKYWDCKKQDILVKSNHCDTHVWINYPGEYVYVAGWIRIGIMFLHSLVKNIRRSRVC